MEKPRKNKVGLIWILVIVIAILACNVSLPGNTAENGSSLSITISNPLGNTTVLPGEEVVITSTSLSDSGISHVELLINGQLIATNSPQEPAVKNFVAFTSWFPNDSGNYQISVVVEDTNNQRVESDPLTIIVLAQVEEETNTPVAINTSIPPTNSPMPSSTQQPSATLEPSATTESSNLPFPIVVTPIPIIVNPIPTIGFIINPIPVVIIGGSPSIHFEIQTTVIAPGTGSLKVYCPEGSIITGGGYYSSALYNLHILISRMATPNGWQIAAKNLTGNDQTVGAVAVCLSNSGGSVAIVQHTELIQGKEDKSISASCPVGSVITSGGWFRSSEIQVVRQSSQAGNNWSVFVENYSNSSSEVTVYAICLSDTTATSYQYMESLDIGPKNDGSAFALCEPGQFVSGGGFFGGVSPHSNVPVGPNATGPKYGWGSYANNPAYNKTFNIQTFATCLSFD